MTRIARWYRGAACLLLATMACSNRDTITTRPALLPSESVDAAGAIDTPPRVEDAGLDAAGQAPASLPDASAGDASPAQVDLCGDGDRSGVEECDDRNTADLDGCSHSCRLELCGNGRVDPGETCDRADATCVACVSVVVNPQSCGNGTREGAETCDDGNALAGDGCNPACQLEVCGDARLDQRALPGGTIVGETCDPPEAGHCDASCRLIVCGDGALVVPESCDDGNTEAGDGCSPTCRVESCGDRVVNQVAGVEECEPPGSLICDGSCRRIECGNGIRQRLEECDGNEDCTTDCTRIECGNSRLDPGEDCEPPGIGACGSLCLAVRVECGDGVRHATEECDDRNVAFGDGCSPTCRAESCGNGRVEAPVEACEPPGTAVCNSTCRIPRCGDGSFDALAGEECEDANVDNGDGCSSTCRIERCGNGRLDPPNEQCEPPGTSNCDGSCRVPPAQPLELGLPLGASLFQLSNPAFDASLEPWLVSRSEPAQVTLSSIDASGAASSGSAQLSLGAESGPSTGAPNLPAVASEEVSAGVAQCVRTSPGAAYFAVVSSRALDPALSLPSGMLQLAARFYAGSGCLGSVLDGVVSTAAPSRTAEWIATRLPPTSPVPGHVATFVAPAGAGSLRLSIALSGLVGEAAQVTLVDAAVLVRVGPRRCGDGLPETGEECEPSVTPACLSGCVLPALCGDAVRAPGECESPSDPRACPGDCPRAPPVCGDGRLAVPEECDPPGTVNDLGVCTPQCTLRRAQCGNGVREGVEACDPPNGATCSPSCTSIACGNGVVEAPEECEPGVSGAACSGNCRLRGAEPSQCGDGLLQGAEECDPPNPDTWCTRNCLRQNPVLACGNGRVDVDLAETCDPPSVVDNCGRDCRGPVCGDGKVGGREQCDPPEGGYCGDNCQLSAVEAPACQRCLGDRCSGTALPEDLYSACYGLEGVALEGPAAGTPLRELCSDVVECLRDTACARDMRGLPGEAQAQQLVTASCYCGKALLVKDRVERARRLRGCRDGLPVPDGPCRRAFERAAQSGSPASVLAAMDAEYGEPALRGALALMEGCAKDTALCKNECSIVASCGNGVIEAGELCEPALPAGVPGPDPRLCGSQCAVLPCGNGVVDTTWPYGPTGSSSDPVLIAFTAPPGWQPETCDIRDPYTSQNDACDNACQLVVTCGDGIVSAAVEACDPGPAGNWSACCRPGDASQSEGCDINRDGQVNAAEGCRTPSVCGDNERTGTEECDPPEPGVCSDDCRAIDACTSCSRVADGEHCELEESDCSGAAIPPAFANACRGVLACVMDSGCAEGGLLSCLCGSSNAGSCLNSGGDGPCRDLLIEHTSCQNAIPPEPCVAARLKNTTYPGGTAVALAECRQTVCLEECFDVAESR